ncbi:probable folate-biopterin transporter 8, chloroplastic isoform X1 [Tanacetum coccineum]
MSKNSSSTSVNVKGDMVDDPVVFYLNKVKKKKASEKNNGIREMLNLCGFGYWVQGFRCFPWLGLNFHMANNMNMNPSTLQLVQNFGMLPMVAKPLYGILSDVFYIGGAHRLPYISIGDVECTTPYVEPLAITTTTAFKVSHEDAYDSDVDEAPHAAAAFDGTI